MRSRQGAYQSTALSNTQIATSLEISKKQRTVSTLTIKARNIAPGICGERKSLDLKIHQQDVIGDREGNRFACQLQDEYNADEKRRELALNKAD